jgi:hypothetical protein
MFKLTSITNTIPKFLYITNVEHEAHRNVFAMGGFSRVSRGRYKGQRAALKTMNKSHYNVSAISSFLFRQY